MINLKETFGRRYRIRMDESYAIEKYPGKEKDIAWYYEIEGWKGQIYNHSEIEIQFWINSSRIATKIHKVHPEWKIQQLCSDGGTFVLPNSVIGEAFKWIKPRKRRIASPGQADRLKSYRFKPATQSTKGPINEPENAPDVLSHKMGVMP